MNWLYFSNANVMLNMILFFLLSFGLHVFILSFIRVGIFGSLLRDKINYNLENKIYLFFIVPFIISFLLLFELNISKIFLESNNDVVVTAVIDNARFEFSGEVLNLIFHNIGA